MYLTYMYSLSDNTTVQVSKGQNERQFAYKKSNENEKVNC